MFVFFIYIHPHILDAVIFLHVLVLDTFVFMHTLHAVMFMHVLDLVIFEHILAGQFVHKIHVGLCKRDGTSFLIVVRPPKAKPTISTQADRSSG